MENTSEAKGWDQKHEDAQLVPTPNHDMCIYVCVKEDTLVGELLSQGKQTIHELHFGCLSALWLNVSKSWIEELPTKSADAPSSSLLNKRSLPAVNWENHETEHRELKTASPNLGRTNLT